MNLLYYSSEDVPNHILMLLNTAPMQLHDKYLKNVLGIARLHAQMSARTHSLTLTHNHMQYFACMTHMFHAIRRGNKELLCFDNACETERAWLYKETHA